MHIEVVGSGAPLVLIHGWALHGGVFAPLVERLSDSFQLYLVDLPGHGHSRESATPLTLEACAQEILAQTPAAVWLGWSLGGLVALHAAAHASQLHAPQVRGLVMIAATPRFVRGADWPHAVEPSVFLQFGNELQQDYRGTLERFLALDTIGSEHARAELRTLKETLYARGEPAPGALQQGLKLLEASDLRADLPALSVPNLWLSGRRDRLVPPDGMRDAAERAPRSRYVDIAGGGHAPFLGQADQVALEIRGFMEGLDAAPVGAT
jgi:pimeloyl-[acyl-carrier protein] methyl ester esterase